MLPRLMLARALGSTLLPAAARMYSPAPSRSLASNYLDSPGFALVTGANRGIGLCVAQLLARAGKKVLVAGRDEEKSAAAAATVAESVPNAPVEPLTLDQSSPQSIAEAVAKLQAKHGRTIDVLVNNAAYCRPGWSAAELEPTLKTNFDGPVALTLALAESLAPQSGALTVTVGSGLGQLRYQDPAYAQALQSAQTLEQVRQAVSTFRPSNTQAEAGPGGSKFDAGTYALSKAALNRAVQLLAQDRRLKEAGVYVVACCPGWCRTDMGNVPAPPGSEQPPRSAEQGAESVVWWLKNFEPSLNGTFNREGVPLPW